ncbi:MAG: hypothetical protein K2M31_07905 [Muribaculaceae bacterium]|nr:hypothetical protein [Muribaculaceae bacterium]
MKVLVKGREAAIKCGSSFEYIQENRLFDDAEGFSLDIDFPMAGCRQNIEIFGYLNRMDCTVQDIVFDAEIIAGNFHRKGVIAVTEHSETDLKGQFLEGRSARSFHERLDNIYINELSIGNADEFKDKDPSIVWNPDKTSCKCVALPWFYENGDSGVLQNCAVYKKPAYNDDMSIKDFGRFEWSEKAGKRTFMPYLIYTLKQIFSAAGYDADLSDLESDPKYKYLLICHTLPESWKISEFGRYLPNWTIEELLENLELFLDGVFEVDGVNRQVVFKFNAQTMEDLQPIELSNIVDEFNSEVSAEYDDVKCEFVSVRNLSYPEIENESWKYLCCDWFIKDYKSKVIEFPSMQNLLSKLRDEKIKFDKTGYAVSIPISRDQFTTSFYYVKDIDAYFIWRPMYQTKIGGDGNSVNYYKLQPLNVCGSRIVSYVDDEDDTLSFGIRPADIEFTEKEFGEALSIDCGTLSEYDDQEDSESEGLVFDLVNPKDRNVQEVSTDEIPTPQIVKNLLKGKKEMPEYFSNLNLAWWGPYYPDLTQESLLLPHPWIEDYVIDNTNASRHIDTPFRISNRKVKINGIGVDYEVIVERKYTFKFLLDYMPDPMALFIIRGKKYICKQIKATFDEIGMSKLLEGEFYQIKD